MTAPLVDELELIDFAIPCAVGTAIIGANGEVVGEPKQCERVAEWAGNCKTCGSVSLCCPPHKEAKIPRFCTQCRNSHDDLTNWRRL